VISAAEIVRSGEAEICRPWRRHLLSHPDWVALTQAAVAESWTLVGHWADTIQAHALFLDPNASMPVAVSTPVESGHYPALSPFIPGAAWYERMILDLWGHVAEGGTDLRAWLDHGTWPIARPMATRPEPRVIAAEPPLLAGFDQADTMVMPLGPIWGRLDEAAHLRLTLDGGIIRRAEALLGFSHKGTLALMRGKSPRAAARFAARLSGDSTVAHSVAFAQATEAASDVAARWPPRRCPGGAHALWHITGEPVARLGCGVRPSFDDGLRCARRSLHGHR
jgi:hypothetical protein